jgi:hypothetical protein
MNAKERTELVRRHFEITRDIVWMEDLEPKLVAQDISKEEIDRYRNEWNYYAEIKHWEWWQESFREYPRERIEGEIMDVVDYADQAGIKERLEKQSYKEMLEKIARGAPHDNKKGVKR